MDIQEYNKFISDNTGYDGLLCQADGDQGDTCQREGLFTALLSFIGDNFLAENHYDNTIDKLRVAPGVYRRASNPAKWYSNPNNLSRDQRAMLELSMAVINETDELSVAAKYIIKNKCLHQNVHPGTDAPDDYRKIPDIVSPGELGVYIRGLNIWWLYPVLTVLDIGLCLDVYLRSKWDGANMLCINIIYANKKYPTLFSKLAKKLLNWEDAKNEITRYYSKEKNGIPDLGKLYCKAIDRFINS